MGCLNAIQDIKWLQTLRSVKGGIHLVYSIYQGHTRAVIRGHLHFFAGVSVVYAIYHTYTSSCHICKKYPCVMTWAIRGDVCQEYTIFFWSCRNLWNFILRHMPGYHQVFGSRYSQDKSEGPLHIPGIYQSVISSGFAGILLVYEVVIWHTPGIRGLTLQRN